MNLPTTMKAAALDRFGGADLIRVRDLPVPPFASDELLLKVAVADVGVWDPEEREGHLATMMQAPPRFPYVLGSDGAGTVVAVGSDVKHVAVGDRAYGFGFLNPKGGFYAEYVVLKGSDVSKIPGELTDEQAGVLPGDALTGLQGLTDQLKLKAGETVLIFGAGGGIGHLAVQLAKRLGTRVFAVASGADGVELATRLGADAAVDGRKDDVVAAAKAFAPDGLDAALFTAGGPAADKCFAALKPAARVAHPEGVAPAPAAPAGYEFKVYSGIPTPESIALLNKLIEAGPFHVEVAKVYTLDQAAIAHGELKIHHLGKYALRVS